MTYTADKKNGKGNIKMVVGHSKLKDFEVMVNMNDL